MLALQVIAFFAVCYAISWGMRNGRNGRRY